MERRHARRNHAATLVGGQTYRADVVGSMHLARHRALIRAQNTASADKLIESSAQVFEILPQARDFRLEG